MNLGQGGSKRRVVAVCRSLSIAHPRRKHNKDRDKEEDVADHPHQRASKLLVFEW
jgi:hypothetical protein